MQVICPLLEAIHKVCTPGEGNTESCACQKGALGGLWGLDYLMRCLHLSSLACCCRSQGEYSRDLSRRCRNSKVPACHSLTMLWSCEATKTSPASLASFDQDRDKRFSAISSVTTWLSMKQCTPLPSHKPIIPLMPCLHSSCIFKLFMT